MSEPVKLRITYNDIHTMIGETAAKIKKDFSIKVAIGGGGFFPARVLRTFLKTKGSKNIPIQAIGLSLYEELPDTTVEQVGTEVIRTQWLDFSTLGEKSLVGKRVLIVDEVDDTRKTLGYAVSELQKDVQEQYKHLPADTPPTEFAIFVVHNKLKEKAAGIPSDVKYFPGAEIEDIWVDYPWEQQDIIEHTRLAEEDKKKQASASQQ
ncbi:hypothetical protein E3Q22_00587 [Wallemia mellicola]|uniref:PRTase-like protein n=3 Tax=Wallemia mellicola TaxID=1708541 RepID=A0A4T0MFB1_9BASI|nr:hypothetical protein E3Q22_00587 [Wallemia mellicola]TIC28070.1 hypothetical protein E3Q10_03376 [Wallemia mellicola]TIC66867.1 hypothetical protein E3Q01_01539 [Wallemia mellicola]